MAYLHIPFCVKKCAYCDFLSGPCSPGEQEEYLEALLAEIRMRRAELRGKRITSIFFGGGTPSLVSPEWIRRLLQAIREAGTIAEDGEITMECNPGTTNLQRLMGYREAGVNRLSIGLQSPKAQELKLLGRIHTWEQFLQTYQWAREAGFTNINVDLMSALPGQTPESWRETLQSILALKPAPEHLSVYSLILEEGTTFWEWQERGAFTGSLALPGEEEDREMYHDTGRLLKEAGYEQEEISNYGKPGYACRHNCGYWERRDYLGFGVGAASLFQGERFTNTPDRKTYVKDPGGCREEVTVLTAKDAMEETMFLGLRMNRGVTKEHFFKSFGVSMEEIYGEVIARYVEEGLLMEDREGVRLTEKGRDLSNYVMAGFLLDV